MDPDRVKAYLQVACAGLGFDIGEVWWTTNESSPTTLPTIENSNNENGAITQREPGDGRHLKFVQLYTSKSYEDRKSMLLCPDSDGRDDETSEAALVKSESDLKKHVLSPQLVNAISNTSQVLWANSQTHEGLLGRSDLPLQTAVGMPVAIDGNGNMCIVVMFSPENLQNTDEAMEYLQFISRSATSSSIPCLLPVFDVGSNMRAPALLPPSSTHSANFPYQNLNGMSPSLGKGVTARFVSLDEDTKFLKYDENSGNTDDLTAIDCFGIPILPTFAELGSHNENPTESSPMDGDAFDDVSFGVWSTIMNTPVDDVLRSANPVSQSFVSMRHSASSASVGSDSSSVLTASRPFLPPQQKERLEEFSSAFLGMSVFDAADAWIPHGGTSADELCHVTSVMSTKTNEALSRFAVVSQNVLIKPWSGAVGRAFASGNAVWSAKRDVIVDSERSGIFDNAAIRTALAIPIFSDQSEVPACVVCYYSILRTDAVPVVLRFVEQALRLLWDGLERIEPHESVGKQLWRDVAPADLGEMAADLEMQQEFLRKKRPRDIITSSEQLKFDKNRERSSSLSLQLQALNMPNQNVPLQNQSGYKEDTTIISMSQGAQPPPSRQMDAMGTHQNDAPPSATTAPQWNTHQHMSTNAEGSKRAHIVVHSPPPQEFPTSSAPQHITTQQHFSTNQFQQVTVTPEGVSTLYPMAQQQNSTHQMYQQVQQYPVSYQDQQLNGSYHEQQQSAPYREQHHVSYQEQQSGLQQEQVSYQNHQQISYQNYQQPVSYQDQQQNQSPVIYGQSQALSQPQLIPLHMPQPLPNQFASSGSSTSAQAPISLQHVNHVPEPPNNFQYQSMPMPTSLASSYISQDPSLASFANTPAVVPYQVQSSGENLSQQQNSNMNYLHENAPIHGSMMYLQNSSPAPIPTGEKVQYFLPAGMTMGIIHIPLVESDKPCRIQGCDDPAVARRPYCAKHSGSRLCENVDCDKCAQGSTRFCIAHGGGRRCTHPGCDKGARDRYFCAAHGGGKRCRYPTCSKSAVGGSSLCTSHGGGRRCAVEGCDKSAQSSTSFCVKHGGGKKCAQEDCDKVARGRTNYCAAHGGGIRCKLEGCNRVAIGKLQLCRAHGGGSNKSKSGAEHSPPLDPVPFMTPGSPLQPNLGVHNI